MSGYMIIAGEKKISEVTFPAPEIAEKETASDYLGEKEYSEAQKQDVDHACAAAEKASYSFAETTLEERANFIDLIAGEIEAIGDVLIKTAMQESGLPQARLEGERGRTAMQLRLFANVVRKGDFIGARIDNAQPDRAPLPKSDLRLRHIPLGPVAVFGASNFPLAFSVAGGDTASAFAAGCPVIVKGHAAHPGTGQLVATAIAAAVKKSGLEAGVFSYLPGAGYEVGTMLVANPNIKAVGFTGSRTGGLALVDVASSRKEPIPVYAEMSCINPVFLLPSKLKTQAETLGASYAGSLVMGAGQFCTNPGVVIGLEGAELDQFITSAASKIDQQASQTMLTDGICEAYERGVKALDNHAKATRLAGGNGGTDGKLANAALFSVTASDFLNDPALTEEIFGATSIIVKCTDEDQMIEVAKSLDGQLTATLQMTAGADTALAKRLLPILERKAGRILCNGWPTGVEVTDAMVHGGPFPSTSDTRSTSVGTLAISRFLRPVCYQDMPHDLLAPSLDDENSYGIDRLVDGKWNR